MADFLLIVLAALVVAGIVFGIVAFALGREPGLSEPSPDTVSERLPDHPLSADDLDQARFDVVIRGYRMDQVGALVDRVAVELRHLHEYVDSLEREVAALRRPSSETVQEDAQEAPEADVAEDDPDSWAEPDRAARSGPA